MNSSLGNVESRACLAVTLRLFYFYLCCPPPSSLFSLYSSAFKHVFLPCSYISLNSKLCLFKNYNQTSALKAIFHRLYQSWPYASTARTIHTWYICLILAVTTLIFVGFFCTFFTVIGSPPLGICSRIEPILRFLFQNVLINPTKFDEKYYEFRLTLK